MLEGNKFINCDIFDASELFLSKNYFLKKCSLIKFYYTTIKLLR